MSFAQTSWSVASCKCKTGYGWAGLNDPPKIPKATQVKTNKTNKNNESSGSKKSPRKGR